MNYYDLILETDSFKEDPTVTIRLADFKELVESAKLVDALQAAGVDNWDGYGYAVEMLEE